MDKTVQCTRYTVIAVFGPRYFIAGIGVEKWRLRTNYFTEQQTANDSRGDRPFAVGLQNRTTAIYNTKHSNNTLVVLWLVD